MSKVRIRGVAYRMGIHFVDGTVGHRWELKVRQSSRISHTTWGQLGSAVFDWSVWVGQSIGTSLSQSSARYLTNNDV